MTKLVARAAVVLAVVAAASAAAFDVSGVRY